jgi:agmatine/peptidylarginine deiminase
MTGYRSWVCLLAVSLVVVQAKISFFTPNDWHTVERDGLPRRMTLKENALMPAYLEAAKAALATTQPASNATLRLVAEFAPMQGVLVRYPLGLPASLVAAFSKDVRVFCLCTSGQQSSATSTFSNAGAVMANITFVNYQTDSYWTRDYGPWWVWADTKITISDFTYNRPRPNDSKVNKQLSGYFSAGYTTSGLTATGGNMMTDGLGVMASTTLVYEENPSLSQQQVLDKVKQYWGIQTYLTQVDPTGDYIEHIDCWGKFLSETDVLIDQYPTSYSHYQDLEDVAAWFGKQVNGQGQPFTVHRVKVKDDEAYSNSLLLNNKAYVPVSGTGADDTAALQVYQTALPDYDIVGVVADAFSPWENTDALHCRTNGIPVFTA